MVPEDIFVLRVLMHTSALEVFFHIMRYINLHYYITLHYSRVSIKLSLYKSARLRFGFSSKFSNHSSYVRNNANTTFTAAIFRLVQFELTFT